LKKSLLIGIAALAVLSLWLVILFGNDSATTNVSFTPPVYASNGGGTLDGCTDSCLYDATISSCLPIWEGYCKMQMEVKHKLYDPDNCCCHTAATIVLEVRQDEQPCDCSIPMVMTHDYDSVNQLPCDYGVYHSCAFVVKSDETYYYKIYDSQATSSCVVSGSYDVYCWEP